MNKVKKTFQSTQLLQSTFWSSLWVHHLFPILQLLEETAKHINDYALVGLRTLAVAKRDLTEEEYRRHTVLYPCATQLLF